jgi:hypothetical protein
VKGQKDEALCYCTCDWADRDKNVAMNWALPPINRKIHECFEIAPCPLAWFLPDNERQSVARNSFLASVMTKAKEWRERVREAEQFWKDNGDIFEAVIR